MDNLNLAMSVYVVSIWEHQKTVKNTQEITILASGNFTVGK